MMRKVVFIIIVIVIICWKLGVMLVRICLVWVVVLIFMFMC